MEKIPSNLLYSKEHEWALDGNIVDVGITHHAQCQLGDVVYIELPKVGSQLQKDKVFGVVESVKAVSDLFAPISGVVVEVNSELVQNPEGVNENPYNWMLKIQPSDRNELVELMDAARYEIYLKDLTK